MILVINYANESYKSTQHYCTESAYRYGADRVIEYGPEDMDPQFVLKYKSILDEKRGAGYWLWKPYIIKRALQIIEYGDYLFYVDSGSYFINKIQYIVDEMEANQDDIIAFKLPYIEREWTKNAVFKYFNVENQYEITNSPQRLATFIFLKKTKRTEEVIAKYLEAASYKRLITDDCDDSDLNNPCFIQHRHDQSIFSVLSKIEKIPLYRDPSEFGGKPKLLLGSYCSPSFDEEVCPKGKYPQLIVLHRKRQVTLYVRFLAAIRRYFPYYVYRILLKCINVFHRGIAK